VTLRIRTAEVKGQLAAAHQRLRVAQHTLKASERSLASRLALLYEQGDNDPLAVVLGATSIADLSGRVEYMNALSEEDLDLASQVQNLRNTLAAEKADQERLQAKAAKALRALETEESALEGKLAEAEDVLGDLNAKKARAEELVKDLEKRYQRELAALYGVKAHDGVFRYCPVDEPRAVYDGFGAPRYGGGYHPHAGNDIIAPQGTPIRATFDGVAAISTNSLGGYAVYVYGELGYTYNAHLMQPGVTGSVLAGDIIGYVGTTGNASTPHNHFEWHPKVIPSDWPVSPYGYSVIGDAVNPFPLLAIVC